MMLELLSKNCIHFIENYMVDVLGFMESVHTQNNKEWAGGLKDERQKNFPQIPVTVTAEISIKSSTLSQEPNKDY
jgi:hypothetical protein